MAIELPGEVVSFLQFIGVNWPNINEDKVRVPEAVAVGPSSGKARTSS
ncbi:MAG: hypothetical protein HOY79_45475 [Streptomyces sp.]|nr:hypothetical protein [Streptomyces sp.]